MRIIWAKKAKSDYLSYLAYLSKEWGESVRQAFVSELLLKEQRILANPQQYRLVQEDIRRCVVDKYIQLYYCIGPQYIEILHFHHSSQRPQY